MRFTLDSASELSADEQISPTVIRKSLPHHRAPTEQPNFASSSSIYTPTRKGILRHTSSYGSSSSNTQYLLRFHPDGQQEQEHTRSDQRDATPRSRTTHASSVLPFQQQNRRRSATPAFELVGVAASTSPSSSRLCASSPAPSSCQQQRSASKKQTGSLPPWMRSSSTRPSRSNLDVYELDSSDEDDTAALSTSDEADDAGLLDAAASDLDSDGSSSPRTSPCDHDSSSDSEEQADPVRPSDSFRSHIKRRRNPQSSLKLANTADDEWEEWNRTSSQLAWLRARSSSKPSASIPRRTPAPLSRSRSTTTAPSADVDEVEALLSSLNMRRTADEARVQVAFDARNKDLWSGIDACILAAENEAKKHAAAEVARLEATRKAQAEAERKAAQARQAELARIDAEKKAAEAEAGRLKQQAEEEAAKAKRSEIEAAKAAAMGGTGDDIRNSALAEYNSWMAKIKHIKTAVLPTISSNPDLRKQCFAAKRQITPKIGQLTNSRAEITRIAQAIASVLDAAKAAAASGSGDVYTWILNHLSKCLIRQAEQEVAAKQDTAYPLARVVVWLILLGHTELGEVLMARLCKKCPWVIPVWPGRSKDMDDATYRKVMGYKSAEETTENHSNRMSGIAAFYFAILQTTPSAPPSAAPMDVEKIPLHLRSTTLWRWSVRALTPSTGKIGFLDHPLCPGIWSVYVEIAGNKALGLYGKQMKKAFNLLLKEGIEDKKGGWLKYCEEMGGVKAASVRLELMLKDWAASSGQSVIVGATKGVEMET
ncbi:related to GLE1 - RNA export mediator [Melanopsichium pennsylvanicum]|uniref:mRNA export factor GLE1 n=2 Tax=Melanopsichium pennsylvanicum TaxID=63383 RepID=A0AAJ4XHJ6_9BASI|nr:related to GLE1-RNA export mediator [Melanopsichium pennsylvanicum 4]SNX82689.1 related to GLE1 - RNA export mediator [Melanopsichium pennsylvanicum]